MFKSTNPYTGQIVFEAETMLEQIAVDQLKLLHQRWLNNWNNTSVEYRIQVLSRVPVLLSEKRDFLSLQITRETGKPISQSFAEIDKCIALCKYYLEFGSEFMKDEKVPFSSREAVITKSGLGVVLGIMPWNFPFWQVFRFAFPALLAGNAVILKPAPEVPYSGQLLSEIFKDCDVFMNMYLEPETIANLISRPEICGLSFTGSTQTGALLASLGGKHLKKMVMELGGSDPFIVFSDADIFAAAATALWARVQNNGQTCIAAKRWLIHEDVYDVFYKELLEKSRDLKVGDPLNPGTQLSCMISARIKEQLENQIQDAIESNGQLEVLPIQSQNNTPTAFMPAVLSGLNAASEAYQFEYFGPVAIIETFSTAEDAIQKANSTRYGLGAAIWTMDKQMFLTTSRRLNTGNVAWNQLLSSDPSIPFGGLNLSGFGKELGKEGMMEFVNRQSLILW